MPGAVALAWRKAVKRWALPAFSGIRPTSGTRPTPRRVSSIAKRSRVPNASRGVVQSQFGLPRPALSIGPWPSFSDSDASSMSLSFSSKGLSFSSAFCSARVVFAVFVFVGIVSSLSNRVDSVSSRQEHDDDHTPDREERVADGVGDGVPEGGDLALGLITNHAERRRRGPRAGDRAEKDRVVEAEDVLANDHAQDKGDSGRLGAPQELADPLLLQAVHEAGPGRDPDDRDEDVETDRV